MGFIVQSLKAFGVKPEQMLAQAPNATGKVKSKPYRLRFSEQFHDVAAALADPWAGIDDLIAAPRPA